MRVPATDLKQRQTAHRDSAILVSNLVKTFGSTRALDRLNLTVETGRVHGFLGPNGAGKSTTIRILLGILRKTAGDARVLGGDPWRDAVTLHRRLAYVLATSQPWSEVPTLVGAALVQAPAVLALAGVVVVVFGLVPCQAVAVSWAMFIASLLTGLLGATLKLPRWVLNLSPFTHVPAAASSATEAVAAAPLVALLAAAGMACFRRRDLAAA